MIRKELLQPVHIAQSWTGLSQQRLDWAFHAYDRFIENLSPDVREHFPRGDEQGEAYVVVFGKTQVGKTTLILDLLGLSGDHLARVSDVLRGGRAIGYSATATAMEYRRSNDSHWRLTSGATTAQGDPTQYDKDADMAAALGDVREQMANKLLQADKPYIVWIPSDCFENSGTGSFSVRMLDLPGVQAADPVERQHVKKMAQRYVPNADLIFLVGRGDDLSFLSPTSLELPGIEDWQIVPHRFRIVITRSFTASSVGVAIRTQKEALTETFLRQRLLEQILTFRPAIRLEWGDDAADPKRFFPLEFGTSWISAKPELVAQLQPVITRLKEELQKDIKASATPLARLRNAVDVHVIVGKVKESRLKQMTGRLVEVKNQRDAVYEECENAKKSCQEVQSECETNQQFLKLLPYDKLKKQVRKGVSLDVSPLLQEIVGLGKNTSHFKYLISQLTSELEAQFLRARPTRTEEDRKFWASVQPRLHQYVSNVEEIVNAEFAPLRRKFADYAFTEYYPILSGDFQSDQQSMRTHMQNSALAVCAWMVKLWEIWAKERLQQLADDMEFSTACKVSLLNALKERQRALKELDLRIEQAEQERHVFVKRMEIDDTNGRKFVGLLEEAYLAELQVRRQRINQAPTATQAFIELLATDQLINERKKIINTLS